MIAKPCPCGSQLEFDICCKPYLSLLHMAPTSEALMRSRYTAYTLHNADYIYNTTLPSERKYHNRADVLTWAKSNTWLKLEILYASETIVEFKAFFMDETLRAEVHHERSVFVQLDGIWYFKDGIHPS